MEHSSVVRATPRSLWSRAVLQIATDIYSTRALFPASHGGPSFVPALSLSASVYVHASRGAPSWVPNKETRIQTSALNPRRHATESAVRHRAGGTKERSFFHQQLRPQPLNHSTGNPYAATHQASADRREGAGKPGPGCAGGEQLVRRRGPAAGNIPYGSSRG